MTAMMDADDVNFDRLRDRAAQPVNLRHLRCGNTLRGSAAVWTALRGISMLDTGPWIVIGVYPRRLFICVHLR